MREVNGGSQGGIWVKMIKDADVDAGHFNDVCYEYASAARKLPEPLDDIIADIIRECKDRRYEELRKGEQLEKYHRPQAGELMQKVSGMGLAGKVAVPLAKLCKEKVITREENDRRMDEIFAYEKGQVERPQWLDDIGL